MSFSNEKIIEEILWHAHAEGHHAELAALVATLLTNAALDRVQAYELAAKQP